MTRSWLIMLLVVIAVVVAGVLSQEQTTTYPDEGGKAFKEGGFGRALTSEEESRDLHEGERVAEEGEVIGWVSGEYVQEDDPDDSDSEETDADEDSSQQDEDEEENVKLFDIARDPKEKEKEDE